MQYTYHYKSPIGGITIASDGENIIGLWFDGQKYFGYTLKETPEQKSLPVFEQTAEWLNTYFQGKSPSFTPPLTFSATGFRESVWNILLTIPYGQTITYGEIAARLARERGIPRLSAQAVGGAVAHNPISIIVPCHRVIGSDGSLTGYAGGIDRKIALLQSEGIDTEKLLLPKSFS